VEIFDDGGRSAPALLEAAQQGLAARLLEAPAVPPPGAGITVYSAIPKGSRADWMVEKLSELGVAALVPLVTARSVVEPGEGKLERFARLARESAKQSRRAGVMAVEPLITLEQALHHLAASGLAAAVLATEMPGIPLSEMDVGAVFIGPEGGWTAAELDQLTAAGLAAARLTGSILRIETAAIAAAAVLQARTPLPSSNF
jgi:16S rRNA (uracil1498-N3)-methyltransferase